MIAVPLPVDRWQRGVDPGALLDDRGRLCSTGHICLALGVDRLWLYGVRSIAHLRELDYELPPGLEWAYRVDPDSGLIEDTETARVIIEANDRPGLGDNERLAAFFASGAPVRFFPYLTLPSGIRPLR